MFAVLFPTYPFNSVVSVVDYNVIELAGEDTIKPALIKEDGVYKIREWGTSPVIRSTQWQRTT